MSDPHPTDLGSALRTAADRESAHARPGASAAIRARADRRRRQHQAGTAVAVAVVAALAVGVGSQFVGQGGSAPAAPGPDRSPAVSTAVTTPGPIDTSPTAGPPQSSPEGAPTTPVLPPPAGDLVLPHDLTEQTGWVDDLETWVADSCGEGEAFPSDVDRVAWRSEVRPAPEGSDVDFQQVATYADPAAAERALADIVERTELCPGRVYSADSRDVYATDRPEFDADPQAGYLRIWSYYESSSTPALGGVLFLVRQEGDTVLLVGVNAEHGDFGNPSTLADATEFLLTGQVLPWVAATG